MFLLQAILNYGFALVALVFAVATSAMLSTGATCFRSLDDPAVATLLLVTVTTLILPRLLVIASLPTVVAVTVISMVIGPAQATIE